jgi:hypothetical protein
MPPPDNRSFLTQQTLVPLGLLVAVLLAAVGGTWQLSQVVGGFQQSLAEQSAAQALKFQRLELKLDAVEAALTSASTDRWTRTEMRAYVETMRVRNPSINFPDIK